MPTLSALLTIKDCRDNSGIESLVESLQALVAWLDIDYLGHQYTRSLLWHLDFVDPSDARAGNAFGADWAVPGSLGEHLPPQPSWSVHGKLLVETIVAELRVRRPEEGAWRGTLSGFDSFGPHERRILASVAYEIEVEVGPARFVVCADEHIVRFIEDEQRRPAVRGERTLEHLAAGGAGKELAQAVAIGRLTVDDIRHAQCWLPGLVAQHERQGHCERQALLEVLWAAMAASKLAAIDPMPTALESGIFDGTDGIAITGHVRLYVAHFCCISCLAAMCHFSRRAPGIQLYVDYDDCWQTRALDV